MAPEILSRTFNDQSFESYKAADMYALGLIFWELLRRCQSSSIDDAEEYQLPYDDVLNDNPTFENMYKIVCLDKHRPVISTRWQNHRVSGRNVRSPSFRSSLDGSILRRIVVGKRSITFEQLSNSK